MKTAIKAVLGAAALSVAALAVPVPATAATGFYFGFGAPVRPYYPPYRVYRPYGEPCFDPYYAPAYCAFPVYSGPIFLGGSWVDGSFPYRDFGGHREFWVHGGWHSAPMGRGGFHHR